MVEDVRGGGVEVRSNYWRGRGGKRSLNNKMEELEAKVDSEEYDIVAVSETWFKEESN